MFREKEGENTKLYVKLRNIQSMTKKRVGINASLSQRGMDVSGYSTYSCSLSKKFQNVGPLIFILHCSMFVFAPADDTRVCLSTRVTMHLWVSGIPVGEICRYQILY